MAEAMTKDEIAAARKRSLQLLEILTRYVHGCSDHHCKIKPKTGMGTNGGCRCFREIAEISYELAIESDKVKNYR